MRDHIDTGSPAEIGRLVAEIGCVLDRDPAVRWAYLFGSAARGEPFRDLDVGVVLDPALAPGARRFGALANALAQAVAPVPVDLVDLQGAAPALRGPAVQQGRLLVDRDPARRKDWEVETQRVWLDLEPWLRRGEQLRLEALRERERRW